MAKYLFPTVLSLLLVSAVFGQKNNETTYTFRQGVSIAHWTDALFQGRTYGDPKWFSEKDVQWIARQGLDHMVIRVSGREVSDENGLNVKRMAVLDSAISWAAREKLGVIIHLQEYPLHVKDSTAGIMQQEAQQLTMQIKCWSEFGKYFARYGQHVRFNIEPSDEWLPKTTTGINRYNNALINEIRKYDSNRKLYVVTAQADSLTFITLPDDPNIIINVKYDAIPIFTGQAWIHASYPDFPGIKFPGKVPDLSVYNLPADFDWAMPKKYANSNISERDVESDLKKYNAWRSKFYPSSELYVPFWGYATGFPFNAANATDKESIANYARAFAKACEENKISWAIYDYNSGMAVNINNEPSVLLEALRLKK